MNTKNPFNNSSEESIISATETNKAEKKIPIIVTIISLLHYAGALSLVVIIWSTFFNPAGSFLSFNSNLHTLFLGLPGSLLHTLKFGAGFSGSGILLISYFVLLTFYCSFVFFLAENLLRGKKWAHSAQIKLSIATLVLFIFLLAGGLMGVFVLLLNAFILTMFLRNQAIKAFFENEELLLIKPKKRKIVFSAIAYLLIITSVLFFSEQYSSSMSQLEERAINRASSQQEMVMIKGMKIIAQTSQGNVTIFANDFFTRTYSWENCARTQVLFPRSKRWIDGSFGAYFSGPNPSWKFCKGIDGSILQEGQMHFQTIEEASSWIAKHKDSVYSNDGLVIYFDKAIHPSGRTGVLKVDVWQIYINDSKPSNLSGASDDKITVIRSY